MSFTVIIGFFSFNEFQQGFIMLLKITVENQFLILNKLKPPYFFPRVVSKSLSKPTNTNEKIPS
jgi:hypothetical protein